MEQRLKGLSVEEAQARVVSGVVRRTRKTTSSAAKTSTPAPPPILPPKKETVEIVDILDEDSDEEESSLIRKRKGTASTAGKEKSPPAKKAKHDQPQSAFALVGQQVEGSSVQVQECLQFCYVNHLSHVVSFNNLLNLCLKIKQPEKVPQLISEMKKKQVPLNVHTYSFWIQSYQLVGDLAGVERVFHEAQEDSFVKDDWVIHSNVASVFIEFGQFEKALLHLEKLKNVLNNSDNPSRNAFQHLISLYAGAGKLDSVIQTWNTLKSKFKVHYKQSYLSLLQALSRLDDIKGLENYFREWESTCKKYDDRVPAVVIGAYLKQEMYYARHMSNS
ncbi:pentatricopeptide repeat-containing protein At4g01990, mitochondrial-like [Silene latifolia]|uniref:pentatricopeptide repeat-containing protein At4g01990, mitochondrial-like n=1 Tax=Silene latifolia TaxID=37657 RepID=UPI003D76E350